MANFCIRAGGVHASLDMAAVIVALDRLQESRASLKIVKDISINNEKRYDDAKANVGMTSSISKSNK